MKAETLRIGELAARSGVSIDTVRYYERRKLLPLAVRSAGGFRLFPGESIERVRFIKQAQDLGFSLDEIGQLLTTGGGATECRNRRDLLKAKLTELDERIKAMRDFRRRLAHHLAACEEELNEHGKVVYFAAVAGAIFTADALRVRVGLKVKDDPVPLCYCFGFEETDARAEIALTGRTTIPQRITAFIKQGMCACEERNPSGACCLGEVNKAVKRLMAEHQANS
jgi:DNA-binding transcriptional MerR regulator